MTRLTIDLTTDVVPSTPTHTTTPTPLPVASVWTVLRRIYVSSSVGLVGFDASRVRYHERVCFLSLDYLSMATRLFGLLCDNAAHDDFYVQHCFLDSTLTTPSSLTDKITCLDSCGRPLKDLKDSTGAAAASTNVSTGALVGSLSSLGPLIRSSPFYLASPLDFTDLLLSLDQELERRRVAFASSQRLSSIRHWRYMVNDYSGRLSWLTVFNVYGLKYPRNLVKSMSVDPLWDKEDYLCGLLIDSGACSTDLHRRYSAYLAARRTKRMFE
ncbi:MAG: hypothetical protein EOP45_09245 [Sphingobacteriaceae bacterium]|nr:MAG: hypothetical protein EOP45_09245 [Sphingobacteriaceae bacterium]